MTKQKSQLIFESKLTGRAQWWSTGVRLVAGLTLMSVSLSKFTRHEDLVEAFSRYGIPFPDQSVYLAGTVEGLGGLLLVLGLFTRIAALVVAGNMAVAVLTGGRIDVDFYHTGLGSLLFVAAVFLVWSGPGRWAIDNIWVTESVPDK